MTVMNFDLEDGLPKISLTLKPEDAERFAAFLAECEAACSKQHEPRFTTCDQKVYNAAQRLAPLEAVLLREGLGQEAVIVGEVFEALTNLPTPGAGSDEEALRLAEQFHDTYERLAPAFGYETRLDTRVFNPDSANGKLMAAVCAALLRSMAGTTAATAWVPVSERLPPMDEDVQLILSSGEQGVGAFSYTEKDGAVVWALPGFFGNYSVTHWMPLRPPPVATVKDSLTPEPQEQGRAK